MTVEQIHQHFSRFGGIKSLTVSFNDNSRYVFIVFEKARSAQASAAIPTHHIYGKPANVHLNVNYSSFINIDLSLVPPHSEASIHILNSLPDECLLEIFKYLEVKDLSTAADACTKFRTIAKDTFVNRCSKMDERTVDEMDARTLARFLRNFGACMTTFVLNCEKKLFGSAQRYLKLFCRHCAVAESALNELTINKLSEALLLDFSKPLKRLFRNLKCLTLRECGDMTNLLSDCAELTELWLSLVLCPGFCDLNFPKLEKLFAYLYNGVLVFTNDDLRRFIRSHRKLKSIRIPLNRQLETSIFRDISLNLEHLEEITFMDEWKLSRNVAEGNFMQLAQLRFLRKLHLNCSRIPLDRFFKALARAETPIRDLSLECLNLSVNVEQGLSMMTKMECLTFKRLNLEGGQLVKVVEGMPHLKNLYVESVNKIVTIDNIEAIVDMLKESTDLNFCDSGNRVIRRHSDVNPIVEAVKRRGNGIKLKIRIKGRWYANLRNLNEQTREWVEFLMR